MNAIRDFQHRSTLAMVVLSLPAGIALFFLVRFLETIGPDPMAVKVLLEEAVKILLFAGVALCLRSGIWSSRTFHRSTALLIPLLCVTAFAVSENVLYYLSFPTSSIYRRLLYSYPIHLNTALLYALAFLSAKLWRIGLFLLIGFVYHLALNRLSLNLGAAAVYLIGIGNLIAVLSLTWRVRVKIVQRSVR